MGSRRISKLITNEVHAIHKSIYMITLEDRAQQFEAFRYRNNETVRLAK